jgi:capsular exopolysaccharide synthesis family protein
LHVIFGIDNDCGLSDVLRDGLLVTDALKSTAVDNLLVLTAGSPTKHPSELLASDRMRQVLDTLKAYSDFVFFDAPSAIAFADAAILSAIVDGVLIVVRANQAPRGSEVQMRGLLNKAKANVIGVVLNDADPETVDSSFFHAHYYRAVDRAEGEERERLPSATPALGPPDEDQEEAPAEKESPEAES